MPPLWPCPLLLLAPLLLAAKPHSLTVRVLDGGLEERSLTLVMDTANSTIEVSWQQWDGPLLTSLLHTAQHLQAHAALLLPERDLGQTRSVRLCLLSHGRVETIPLSDMAAIHQNDAGSLKTADEERSTEVLSSLRVLRPSAIARLPLAVRSFCAAAEAVLMPQEDAVSFWGSDVNEHSFFRPAGHLRTLDLPCHVSVCLLWVPCALSCKPPPAGELSQAREERTCGVRVCRHCFRFELESSPSARCV